jgi:hypothetical protein
MRSIYRSLGAATAGLLAAVVFGAHAQNPPPGALEDLGANAGFGVATPHVTTPFSFTFVASDSFTTVSFAFREIPAFFAFSGASITDGAGPNLLIDPNFEGSTVGSFVPFNWGRWIQPIDVSAIGEISSPSSVYGCGNIVPTTPTTMFWCDGSVEGYDAIFQSIATTVGDTYTIAFNLADNGPEWENPGIDMLVYALNGINTTPVGTTVDCPTCAAAPPPAGAPEPGTIALLGLGAAAFALRRRRN